MCIIEAMRLVEGVLLNKDEREYPPYPWGDSGPAAVKYEVKTRQKLPFRPSTCSDDQWALIAKMCAHEAGERISVGAVVFDLERFAGSNNAPIDVPEVEPEPLEEVNSYEQGTLVEQMKIIRHLADQDDGNALQQQAARDLESLFKWLQQSSRPHWLLWRFHKLVIGFCRAVDADGFQQYRILDLDSTLRDLDVLYCHQFSFEVVRLWTTLGAAVTDTVRQNAHRSGLAKTQVDLVVSEESQTWMLLLDLYSEEARRAFLSFLSKEIESQGSNYTRGQLSTVQEACDAIAEPSPLRELVTKPKWFVSWYELENYTIQALGEGGFGRVHLARWLGSTVAVKELDTDWNARDSFGSWNGSSGGDSLILDSPTGPERRDALRMFWREVEVWFSLSHPHVVRLYGACHLGAPFFVCEYAAEGPLHRYLRDHPDEVWQKLHETALGIQYLHERGVIHGSLKSNDIVVAGDGKAKVTDFGLSGMRDQSRKFVVVSYGKAEVTDVGRGAVSAQSDDYRAQMLALGLSQWTAPECLQGVEATPESGIYSLGMCIIQAMRVVSEPAYLSWDDTLPWGNLDGVAVRYHVRCRQFPLRPHLCTDEEWALVIRMCQYEPSERTTIDVVVEILEKLAITSELPAHSSDRRKL